MSRAQRNEFDVSKIVESKTFNKSLKRFGKPPSVGQNIFEFKKALERTQVLTALRYEHDLDEHKIISYYARWPLIQNVGKSHNTRIWFCYIPDLSTIVLLDVYTHSQGVDDHKKQDVEKLIKRAIEEFNLFE